MRVDLEQFRVLERDGYLKSRAHPNMDLLIWNYTAKCAGDAHWNDETMMCRGLITDGAGRIIERPLRKFFNRDEHVRDIGLLPAETPTVWDKLDGSLGILYETHYGRARIATRGSFESPQANEGTEILREKYPNLLVDMIYTLLFEIIYPGNRIVVDYGSDRDLVLVAAIDRLSGESAPAGTLSSIAASNGLRVARCFGSTITAARPNSEGVVLHFENADIRVKVKYKEYVQLHRLLTHASPRTVWESLRAGTFDAPDDVIRIPKQYREWAFAAAAKIRGDFYEVHREAFAAYSALDKSQSRKDLARYILSHHAGITALLFALLDGKNISDRIWQMVRPTTGRPFWGAGEDTDHA